MDYVKSNFLEMNLWTVEHFFPHFRVPLVLLVPQSEEKSVQLVRGSSFRSDFIKKSYFKHSNSFQYLLINYLAINLDATNWLNFLIAESECKFNPAMPNRYTQWCCYLHLKLKIYAKETPEFSRVHSYHDFVGG